MAVHETEILCRSIVIYRSYCVSFPAMAGWRQCNQSGNISGKIFFLCNSLSS